MFKRLLRGDNFPTQLCRSCKLSHVSSRFQSKVRTSAVLDAEVREMVQNGLHPKMQPGKRSIPNVVVPLILEEACHKVIQKYKRPGIWDDIVSLRNKIHHRQLPAEQEDVRIKTRELEYRYDEIDRKKAESLADLPEEEIRQIRQRQIERALKRELYNWQPIDYDDYTSVIYMASRLPANFAALKAVFTEISRDDPSFTPQSLFDFGSGVGTVLWAAREIWPKSIHECFAVDISTKATEIADLLLRKGSPRKPPIFDNLVTRQFLPVSSDTKYDLVVSAFSLLDLPSRSARVNTIENLWHKTSDILVIIEHGKKAGFSTVLEARNLILEITGHRVTETFSVSPDQQELVHQNDKDIPCSHVMAPCPHHFPCPRLFQGEVTPCCFSVSYNQLKVGELTKKLAGNREIFSYVVLRKKPIKLRDTPPWPRLIKPVIRKHRTANCGLCCPDGTLKSVLITKAFHERSLYKLAKMAKWSDLLPITVVEYIKTDEGRLYLTPGQKLLAEAVPTSTHAKEMDFSTTSDSEPDSSEYSSDEDVTSESYSEKEDKSNANGRSKGARKKRK